MNTKMFVTWERGQIEIQNKFYKNFLLFLRLKPISEIISTCYETSCIITKIES